MKLAALSGNLAAIAMTKRERQGIEWEEALLLTRHDRRVRGHLNPAAPGLVDGHAR
jgi:hypothetical protein